MSCEEERKQESGVGNRFDVQENWPHCLQSAPSGPDGRCRWCSWGSSSTKSAASLFSSVRFFIPGPPVALALCQFSNKVSPSKSPLPIAFPDLLCHRHFSTSLAFFTPPEANHKLGIWSRNLIWKMISGSMMQKCGSETLMGENSMKLMLMRNHYPGQLGLNPTGDPLEDWIPLKSGLPQRQGRQIWTYPMSSVTSWGLLPGSKLWPLWPALHIGRASSYSQRDLQGVEGTICGWPAG